jgi:heme-degrading monooxygenase HmoA/pimeloyl-ACP methyl ester carboxylesterase
MLALLAALTLAGTAPSEEILMLRDPGEPALSVHHEPGPGPSVLYVHGATFPAALSMNYRIDGKSWADDLHSRGFDVWSFDFAGYGGSDRPASMQLASVPRDRIPDRAPDAARQIERVVRAIRAQMHRPRVSIIAHSWGTIPAGLFTGTHTDWVDRLVMFGPVAQRNGDEHHTSPAAPFRLITATDQWNSFQSGVPERAGSPISKTHFDQWVEAYLATDPTSGQRTPPSAKAPAGPDADFDEAWSGHLPYDPSLIRVPTLIVRGEWDPIAKDADAAWLVKAMNNVPGGARDVKLRRGAHRMYLEENRQALFNAVGDFLSNVRPMIAVIFEVVPNPAHKQRYLDLAAQLKPELEKIDGFISIERFQSLTDPGKILSLSFWRDEEAVKRWRTETDHRQAQAEGRNGIFDDYRLRVAKVLRDYGMYDRAEAPADSKRAHSPGR